MQGAKLKQKLKMFERDSFLDKEKTREKTAEVIIKMSEKQGVNDVMVSIGIITAQLQESSVQNVKSRIISQQHETSAYFQPYESEPSRDTVRQLAPPEKKTSGKRSSLLILKLTKVLKAIKALTGNRSKRDSFDVYGEHVANKLRTYKAFIRSNVEQKINCLLHDADTQMIYQSQEQWNQRPTYLPPVSVSSASSSSYPSPFPFPHPGNQKAFDIL
ncbi:unnamed protein product [Psylliodes chrysocephalus]|uniref:Uncharacterized protein n=1 Tax=Psylliodes chrysocephalus TaxID=3402493 RepID=A0A9P0D5P9_9CUCU|nr:unnamed protein product [Psylliodes chrysocephala]